MPGFVLDEVALRNVDESARAAIMQASNDAHPKFQYAVTNTSDRTLNFETIEELLARLRKAPEDIETISFRQTSSDSGVKVAFRRVGEVQLSGFSESPEFQFEFDRVRESIVKTMEPYGRIIRYFAIRKRVGSLLVLGIVLASMVLGADTSYYFYARSVGVNIEDTSVLPTGNEYLRRAAEALKSNDPNKKLDALLMAQLEGFENVSGVLVRQARRIKIELAAIGTLLVLMLVRKLLVALYPLSVFMFGLNEKRYQRLQGKRQIWGIAIGAAFVVNLIAGLIVAFALK